MKTETGKRQREQTCWNDVQLSCLKLVIMGVFKKMLTQQKTDTILLHAYIKNITLTELRESTRSVKGSYDINYFIFDLFNYVRD